MKGIGRFLCYHYPITSYHQTGNVMTSFSCRYSISSNVFVVPSAKFLGFKAHAFKGVLFHRNAMVNFLQVLYTSLSGRHLSLHFLQLGNGLYNKNVSIRDDDITSSTNITTLVEKRLLHSTQGDEMRRCLKRLYCFELLVIFKTWKGSSTDRTGVLANVFPSSPKSFAPSRVSHFPRLHPLRLEPRHLPGLLQIKESIVA